MRYVDIRANPGLDIGCSKIPQRSWLHKHPVRSIPYTCFLSGQRTIWPVNQDEEPQGAFQLTVGSDPYHFHVGEQWRGKKYECSYLNHIYQTTPGYPRSSIFVGGYSKIHYCHVRLDLYLVLSYDLTLLLGRPQNRPLWGISSRTCWILFKSVERWHWHMMICALHSTFLLYSVLSCFSKSHSSINQNSIANATD